MSCLEIFGCWFIGVVVISCIAGLLNRGSKLDDNETGVLTWAIAIWPFTISVALLSGVVLGIPFLLFNYFAGNIDEEVKMVKEWLGEQWERLNNK